MVLKLQRGSYGSKILKLNTAPLKLRAIEGSVLASTKSVNNLAKKVMPNSSVQEVPVVVVSGVGIHTGKVYSVKIIPGLLSNVDESPIEFFTHHEGVEYSCPALWTRLSGTARSTALVLRGESHRKFELRTVEHFLAAAFMLNIQARVEIEPVGHSSEVFEMPILDGAAGEWMHALKSLANQKRVRKNQKVWIPIRELEIADGAKRVVISPHTAGVNSLCTVYSCSVDFAPSWKQSVDFVVDWTSTESAQREFESKIAPARTFGFVRELEALAARGLAMGGSLENALVLDEDKVVNAEGFKVPNELASHKLLDAVGDFALLGAPILGKILVSQAGHSMHMRAMEEAVRTGAIVEATLTDQGEIISSL